MTRYVLLNPGETIEEGDEFYVPSEWTWVPVVVTVGEKKTGDWPVRRADLSPIPDAPALLPSALQLPLIARLIKDSKYAWEVYRNSRHSLAADDAMNRLGASLAALGSAK